jgi:hypothetical protein
MYQPEMQQGIRIYPMHPSSDYLARYKLGPVLEAMTDAGDPESDDDYEDDARDERETEDVRSKSLGTELGKGGRCGHVCVYLVSLWEPLGDYEVGCFGGWLFEHGKVRPGDDL